MRSDDFMYRLPAGIVRFLQAAPSALVLIVLMSGTAAAQSAAGPLAPPVLRTRPTSSTRPDARIDVTMVLVPVTVTDQMDRPVMDLTSGSFKIFEDGVEQSVVSVHREDGPISIGFIFDASTSM